MKQEKKKKKYNSNNNIFLKPPLIMSLTTPVSHSQHSPSQWALQCLWVCLWPIRHCGYNSDPDLIPVHSWICPASPHLPKINPFSAVGVLVYSDIPQMQGFTRADHGDSICSLCSWTERFLYFFLNCIAPLGLSFAFGPISACRWPCCACTLPGWEGAKAAADWSLLMIGALICSGWSGIRQPQLGYAYACGERDQQKDATDWDKFTLVEDPPSICRGRGSGGKVGDCNGHLPLVHHSTSLKAIIMLSRSTSQMWAFHFHSLSCLARPTVVLSWAHSSNPTL